MARKRKSSSAGSASKIRTGSDRDKIIEALLELLTEKRFEQIGLGEIASKANVSLANLRAEFGSTLAILAAHIKNVDREVLAGVDPAIAEEPAREQLFDVLMRRLELLQPFREAIRSLMRSAAFNPGLAIALNAMAVRSQQWMLTAANIPAAGPMGQIRAQGLALLFANVLRTWIDDEEKGLSRTLAALDRALASGQRWVGLIDDICAVPTRICRVVKRPRGRRRGSNRDEAMAA